MKKQDSVIVKKNALGKAVYAARGFRKGAEIAAIEGTIISDSDYGSNYCIDLGEGRVLEPKAPFRFLNHSCEPNCELVHWEIEGTSDSYVGIRTLMSVRPGDELTIDYGWPSDSAIPCKCGKAKCRGWVVAEAEVADVPAC